MLAEAHHWVEAEDEEFTGLTWAYGPQGHPASFRVIIAFETSFKKNLAETKVSVWIMRVMGDPIYKEEQLFDIETQVNPWLRYGREVEKRFGRSPLWGKCSNGKSYCAPACPACNALQEQAKIETREWQGRFPGP